ncbi:MAG: hypothetical protein ACFFB2_00520 [Promethearchaeota archaeon]
MKSLLRIYHRIRSFLLIGIFFISFFVADSSIQADKPQESSNILGKLMHNIGLVKQNIEEPIIISKSKSRLISTEVGKQTSKNNESFPSRMTAKIVGSQEDFVDNNISNIDGVADKGTHLNFQNQKAGPDSLNDTLTEEDINTINQISLEVDSWEITRNKWAKTGASPYLDNQTQPEVNEVHGVANAVGSKNGDEMGDFGFQDINILGTLASVKLRVYGHASPSYPTETYFSVHLWNGSAWNEVMDFSNEPNFIWKEVDVSTYINTWAKVNSSKIFLRTEDPGGNKYGEQLCDIAILQVNYFPEPNYNFDAEVQWVSADFTKSNATLAIYTGNLGIEALKVDVWNGSWNTIIPNLVANSWNNISVVNYLTTSTFTIRFKGTNESSDTTQDQWNIDVTLLHTWDNDETPPMINDFFVDDLGTGIGIFWANVTDSQSEVAEVDLEVNSVEYSMNYNGSLWVKQISVNYGQYYEFQVINASDSENYILSPSEIRNHTFDYDSTIPTVENWEYYPNIGINGTFKANVSDTWGEIDTVLVNVTEVDGIPRNDLWAIMGLTASGYINNTLFLNKNKVFNFTIFVNDTSGNSYTSLKHTGSGPNHPPQASNLSLTIDPRTNESLIANWTFSDVDGDDEPLNSWIIRWYKSGVLQDLYNNLKIIPSTATSKGEIWNYTLQVSDGDKYSLQYNSPPTTIINTPPEAINVTITSKPTSSDELVAGWTASDIDGDNPDNYLHVTIIRWYLWTGSWTEIPGLMNSTYVTAGNLTRSQTYRFKLELFDGEEYSKVYISPNTTILNSLPILTATPTFNKTTDIFPTDNINITYSYSDPDGDLEETTQRIVLWYWNGELNSSKTNNVTLLSSETSSGETWQYRLQVYDGFNYSIIYTSILISIGAYTNNIPEVQNITLTGGINTTTVDLVASYDFFDLDGHQEVEKEIIWFMNGDIQPDHNNSLIIGSSFTVKGQIWNFTIKVFDGLNWSSQYVSNELIIQNSIPKVTDIQITSNTTTIHNLTITWDIFDADNDDEDSFNLRWYINNIYNSSFDDLSEISSLNTKKGEEWICSIRIYDSENYSIWYNSSTTHILNTPPLIQDLELTGGENTSQNIILNYEFIDDDNDSENVAINWFYIDGSIIPGETGVELPNTYFVAGNILYAQIIPNDGEVSGNIYRTEYIQIGNAIPQIIGSPEILGFNGSSIYFAAVPLYVNYTAEDLDSPIYIYDIEIDENGLVSNSNYKWYKDGDIVSELTGPTVPTYYLSKGDTWIVSVQIKDRFNDVSFWKNSSTIVIGNTPPEIGSFTWSTSSPTVQNDLSFSYTYYDLDSDSESKSQVIIFWYKNGTEIARNQSTLSSFLFNRGDEINVSIRVSDGEDYSLFYNSTTVIVVNAIPEAYNLAITPSNPYTYDTLALDYDFIDYDNDNESSEWIIHWVRNGLPVSEFVNKTKVNASYTSAGEVWFAYLTVFDSLDYSQEYTVPYKIILNSAPRILSVSINENTNTSYADSNLFLNPNEDITFYDPDLDPILGYTITWVRNYTFQPIYTDQTTILNSELSKGDVWFVIVRVFDGKDWSSNQSSQEVFIINKSPEVLDLRVINTAFSDFLLENENIVLAYTFLDIDYDTDSSVINWYRNQTLLPEYSNLTVIPASATSPGDIWYVEIQPYDGESFGTQMNISMHIESHPMINEISIEINLDKEGHYTFLINVTDPRNPISETILIFSFQNDTLEQTKWAEFNGSEWILDYELENYSLLGNLVKIEVIAISEVYYSTRFEISSSSIFYYEMEDNVAPRVIDAFFEKDDESNPRYLTFYTQIEEFGIGVDEVILYYYFQPYTEGSGASNTNWLSSSMIFQNRSIMDGLEYWAVVVDFNHNNSNFEILYYISTSDLSGNKNALAFDIRDFPQRISENRFIYKSPGLPEWLVILSFILVFCILIGSVAYIKFIRKPELVGFDKKVVMKNVTKISHEEVIASMDLHTLGIVLSYFDQRSGPLPLIVIPDLLQDNIAPLIALSDRSFNSCGFASDFTSKTFSSFDYSLESLIRVNSMSYGYSIENPEARGGAEHFTVNILVVPEIFPLINQFKEELQDSVHDIHMLMTIEPENKSGILSSVVNLREKVSYIVLSYKDIYQTTELIEEG